VTLAVDNHGTAPLVVRAVRLDGRVLGLSFFTFSSRIDLVVPPGARRERVIDLDLGELGDQATGLIPGTLSLVGPDRAVISEQPLATDVRGSLLSPYGAFGLVVGAVTLVLAAGLAWEIASRRLPGNRWRRGVRFLAPGLGLGLSATFTLSATRALAPGAAVWVPLVLLCGAGAFVLGYLTPIPGSETDRPLEPAGYDQLSAADLLPAVESARHPAVAQLPQAAERSLPAGLDITALEPGVRTEDPYHQERRSAGRYSGSVVDWSNTRRGLPAGSVNVAARPPGTSMIPPTGFRVGWSATKRSTSSTPKNPPASRSTPPFPGTSSISSTSVPGRAKAAVDRPSRQDSSRPSVSR
jgi:hypothetical protein